MAERTVLRLGQHVVSDPEICGGSPTVLGTRVPVRVITGWWKAGMTLDEIMDGYPHLRPEQVTAALTYYFENREEIEREIEANSEAQWRPLTRIAEAVA